MVCLHATKQKTMCACVETTTKDNAIKRVADRKPKGVILLMNWEYRNLRTRRGPTN